MVGEKDNRISWETGYIEAINKLAEEISKYIEDKRLRFLTVGEERKIIERSQTRMNPKILSWNRRS